jgi:adenylate kinase
MKTFMFHGPSGSGKDTQVDLLADYLDMAKINTGDMYRTMPGEGDEMAIKWAKKVWEEGLFPKAEITYTLLDRYVKRFDPKKDWVFVSIVRTLDQIPAYDEFIEKQGRELDAFVHFKLDEDVAIKRLSQREFCTVCKKTYHKVHNPSKVDGICDIEGAKLETRPDDQPEQIRARLKQYNESIGPILEHFKGVLVEIDASSTIDEIHKEIIEKLNLEKK